MVNRLWTIDLGETPVVAAAIHDGHTLRQEIAALMALDESQRLREEDPYTGILTEIADNRIKVLVSRFEMDLNRPSPKAIYRVPEDAWGLDIWNQPLSEKVIKQSMLNYDAFYHDVFSLLKGLEEKHGRFIVLDLHSYCHRRNGPGQCPDDPKLNPDINLGTGTMDRSRWANVVDHFISDVNAQTFQGKPIDIRENIRFRGGGFSQWIHETFPDTGCALAVEIKKIFMDEWTGEVDADALNEIKTVLRATVPGLLEELDRMR